MGIWLTWISGIDWQNVPSDAVARLTWTNAPQSLNAFLLVAGVAGLVVLSFGVYRREIPTCSRRVRIALACLRSATILLLAIVFLGPAVSFTQTKTVRPTIVLLRDASYSMNEIDEYVDDRAAEAAAHILGEAVETVRASGLRRADIVDRLLQQEDAALIRALAEKGRIRLFDFAGTTNSVDVHLADGPQDAENTSDRGAEVRTDENAPVIPPLVAEGQGTDLVRALRVALDQSNVTAILLLSDGQHTVQGSGRNDLLKKAYEARDGQTLIMAVGLGDPTRVANLEVVDLYASKEVWENDPFEIEAILRLQNVTVPSVQLTLMQQSMDERGNAVGEFQVVQRKDVEVPTDGGQIQVLFDHAVKQKGQYAYTVRADPVEGEQNLKDNQPPAPIQVRVLSEIRVLLIAGRASWEYQLLRRLFQREKSVTLSCWLQNLDSARAQDGNRVIHQFPNSAVALSEYDVIMMVDASPAGIDQKWIGILKELVASEARGFFYMAGNQFSTRLLSARGSRELVDLLPVEFGDLERIELVTLDDGYTRPWSMLPVSRNVDHPMMRFFADAERTLIKWQSMPDVYWSFPATGAKPSGRVLIQRAESASTGDTLRPILASGRYGVGRTVYMGFNGTWRWRRTPNEIPYYRRFWLQTLRYLVEGRSSAGGGRGELETDRERYELGEQVTVYARRLKDQSFELMNQEELTAELQLPDKQSDKLKLRKTPGRPGDYSATLIARQTGLYQLQLDNTSGSARDMPATSFRVTVPQIELKATWLDKPLLTEVAEASGGKYYDVDEMDDLVANIPDRNERLQVRGEPIPLWDNSRVLMLFVGLLCAEWALRKRFRLM